MANPSPQIENLCPMQAKWKNTPTKAIRVPECFAPELLEIARSMDRGEYATTPDPDSILEWIGLSDLETLATIEVAIALRRSAIEQAAKLKTFQLTIHNMPARDKRGWVKQGERFLNAASQSSHGSSAQKLIFELEDGIYEVQDANYGSSRTWRYWLKIESGVGSEIEKPKPKILSDLWKIEGSDKQISWAETIREKAIVEAMAKNKETAIIETLLQSYLIPDSWYKAKFWIDYRDVDLGKTVVAWLLKTTKENTHSYPEKVWQEYDEKCAHEGLGGRYIWQTKGIEEELYPGFEGVCGHPIFCQNPDTQEWEVWHYVPSLL
jgi:hypothetical protein